MVLMLWKQAYKRVRSVVAVVVVVAGRRWVGRGRDEHRQRQQWPRRYDLISTKLVSVARGAWDRLDDGEEDRLFYREDWCEAVDAPFCAVALSALVHCRY